MMCHIASDTIVLGMSSGIDVCKTILYESLHAKVSHVKNGSFEITNKLPRLKPTDVFEDTFMLC